jgi:protein phosphatase
MNFNVGFQTDIGRKRSQNQDSGIALPDLGLFVVADGMGGHKGGEIASAIAVEAIPGSVRRAKGSAVWDARAAITEAIHEANNAIFKRSQAQTELQGMGTTTTALLFSPTAQGDTLTIGHVGDSRCYFIRPGAIWQITRDHSIVQEKLRAGLITRDQMKTDRMKNVITRSVGFEGVVDVDVYQMLVRAGDLFLVCSDGLSGLIDDPEILKVIDQTAFNTHDLQKTVQNLVQQANANGGDDNITAVLIEVLASVGM